MALSTEPTLPPVRHLTEEEWEAFVDGKARELLGISFDEFVRRYRDGDYDEIVDDPEHSDIAYLLVLGDVR